MKDFKKYYSIPATPEEVYAALTHEGTLQLWTGDKVTMQPIAGTEFSLWDDGIVGKNLEFEQGKKIVQQWYFDQEEPSIVTIKLHADKQYTSMEVRQTNIPDDAYADIVDGWDTEYVAGLIDFYNE